MIKYIGVILLGLALEMVCYAHGGVVCGPKDGSIEKGKEVRNE